MLGIDLLESGVAGALLAVASLPLMVLVLGIAGLGSSAAHAVSPIIRSLDWISNQIFLWARWLALWLVLVQFLVVVLRYAFGIGFIFLQEALLYFHGSLFMLAAAGALLHEGHVRIDVIYRGLSQRGKAVIDLIGTYVFLIPVVGVIAAVSFPYVAASWAVLEGSKETSGIPAVFALKTIIMVFAGMMYAQGISFALRAALVILGQTPPTKPPGPVVIA